MVRKDMDRLHHANSVTYMTEKSQRSGSNPKYLYEKTSQLIDEWQVVPAIWDAVRHECDSDHEKNRIYSDGFHNAEKKKTWRPFSYRHRKDCPASDEPDEPF